MNFWDDPVDEVIEWFIPAGDDGLLKDCVAVNTVNNNELVSVSLKLAYQGEEKSG